MPESKSKKILIVSSIIIGFIILITILLTITNQKTMKPTKEEYCGDSYCSNNENCNNCEKDCPCQLNEECNNEGMCEKKITMLCGDGICLPEEENNCCKDCGCMNNEICDTSTNYCTRTEKRGICGDNKCELQENIMNCCTDCTCLEGYQCNNQTNQCEIKKEKKPVCPDNICSIGEDPWNCCNDCPCNQAGMTCDTISHTCTNSVEISLTEEEGIQILKEYLSSQGIDEQKQNTYQYLAQKSISQGIAVIRSCYKENKTYTAGGCLIINEQKEIQGFESYI